MREIIFRGKRTDNGEWVEGLLSYSPYGEPEMIEVFSEKTKGIYYEPVDPETVGQYTGLNDCKGNRIFEGDIIRNDDPTKKYRIGEVRFQDGCFCIFIKGVPCEYITLDSLFRNHDAEVIGNRWDNPELLVTA